MHPTLVVSFRRARWTLGALAAAALAACAPDRSPTAPRTAPSDAPSRYTYPSALYLSHVEFGTPFDASTSGDHLMSKRTHALSYNCARGGPNWVSWNLNKTHYGDAPRASSFYADATLPAGCYRVVTSDYTNSGYSRGHMVRSEERTWSADDNRQTFLMTNILPQYQDLNGGPWYKFEQYLQDLAQTQNKELFVISGGSGTRGTLNGAGRVAIPTATWKVVVVLPYGKGLSSVTSTTSLQVIAVSMPNTTGITTRPWTDYRTTVDRIEAATGYNFLDRLPDAIESYWESRT